MYKRQGLDEDCDGEIDEAPAVSLCAAPPNATPRCAMGALSLIHISEPTRPY